MDRDDGVFVGTLCYGPGLQPDAFSSALTFSSKLKSNTAAVGGIWLACMLSMSARNASSFFCASGAMAPSSAITLRSSS